MQAKKHDENQARAPQRSPEEQLRRLDERLGKNRGAHKERARLQKLIEARRRKA